MARTQVLHHGAKIRLPEWSQPFFATLGTVIGYATQNNQDPDVALARAIANNFELVYSIYTGSILTDSPSYYETKVKEYNAAIVLHIGQIVEIEGTLYDVKAATAYDVNKPTHSGPIKFIKSNANAQKPSEPDLGPKSETNFTIDKERIIHELCDGLKAHMLSNLDRAPAEWDGIELRSWMVEVAKSRYSMKMEGKRKKDFFNEILVRNLT